jgi:hypothetical protein
MTTVIPTSKEQNMVQESEIVKELNDLLNSQEAFARFFGEPIWVPRLEALTPSKRKRL